MGDGIEDEALARELVVRLNRLIENEDVREAVSSLLGTRVPVSDVIGDDHPTIQTQVLKEAGDDEVATMGFLGLLNGIVGIRGREPRKLWGFIQAELANDNYTVQCFRVDAV